MKGGLLQPAIICNTLFDTGANPFNYTYLYFINRIKSQVPIDINMVDEPVNKNGTVERYSHFYVIYFIILNVIDLQIYFLIHQMKD